MTCPNCGAPMDNKEALSCKYCMKKTKFHIDNMVIKDFSFNEIENSMLKDNFLTNCLKCGAPLNYDLNGKCEYCGVANNTERTEWILTEVNDVDAIPYEVSNNNGKNEKLRKK